MIDALYRRTLLAVAGSPAVERLVREQGWKVGVGRFVAGERLEDALAALRELEREGLHGILDLLGEFVATEEGVAAMTEEVLRTLSALGREPVARTMSVKPTQLGLAVSDELALRNARRVLEHARAAQAHVCLDMENHPYVDGTLRLYEALRNEGFTHVSTVLQSYLRRSGDDLERLLAADPATEVRIVKGAYREPEDVAFQDKATVDARYRALVLRGLEAGAKVNVATHDESILREIAAFVRGAGLGEGAYEFQLLYGVKPALQRRLLREGHTVRIYIPYGSDWYGYFSRRLAERPANLAFVLRGLVG